MAVIEAEHLTKRFGKRVLAVDDVTFAIEPGTITGVLGPNGAGKTTTLRMILDLVRPTSGTVRILGSRYRELRAPAKRVGALLDSSGFHPGRSGRNALRVIAAGAGIPYERADEVLELVELDGAAQRRVKGYSTGMKQRLALAASLLGDPEVLILDEPANGLDPEGMRWLRTFLRGRAAEGRTVLVSSHVLAEVEQTVDDVLILSEGRLLAQGPDQRAHRLGAAGGARALAPGAGAGGRARRQRRGREPPPRRARRPRAERGAGRRPRPLLRGAAPRASHGAAQPGGPLPADRRDAARRRDRRGGRRRRPARACRPAGRRSAAGRPAAGGLPGSDT